MNSQRAPLLENPLVDLISDALGPNAERVPYHLWEEALGGPLKDFLSRPGKAFRAELVRAG